MKNAQLNDEQNLAVLWKAERIQKEVYRIELARIVESIAADPFQVAEAVLEYQKEQESLRQFALSRVM